MPAFTIGWPPPLACLALSHAVNEVKLSHLVAAVGYGSMVGAALQHYVNGTYIQSCEQIMQARPVLFGHGQPQASRAACRP